MLNVLRAYLGIMNLAGLFLMKADKGKARRHARRIPERTLFYVSLLGGSAGTWAGMYLFRHKTKHLSFVIGMPLIFVAHIVLAIFARRAFFG